VPPYPNSQNAQVKNLSKDPAQTWQTLEFETQDTGRVVSDYYVDVLLKDGWYQKADVRPQTGSISLFCCDASDGSSFFRITIEVEQTRNKQTKTKIELYEELPF
jgi:hypothetical protein